ncbi:MAG: flavin reductase family protein [Rubricella sp.]
MPLTDPRAFRDALGAYPTGVTVVTTLTPDGPVGMTVNSFASLSLDPPLVLWSPARASRRFAALTECPAFTIHILSETQKALAIAFARSGHDAFGDFEWAQGPSGPEFQGAAALLRCSMEAVHPGGDHSIVVGRVESYDHAPDLTPLVFHRGDFPSLR